MAAHRAPRPRRLRRATRATARGIRRATLATGRATARVAHASFRGGVALARGTGRGAVAAAPTVGRVARVALVTLATLTLATLWVGTLATLLSLSLMIPRGGTLRAQVGKHAGPVLSAVGTRALSALAPAVQGEPATPPHPTPVAEDEDDTSVWPPLAEGEDPWQDTPGQRAMRGLQDQAA